mmetsp:Transcript_36151/g.81252  ORF Transcript_36151/g.81252 Transcript_36151/m.81252 type:complete len:362 (+) Transcript_36151:305-1390(+)
MAAESARLSVLVENRFGIHDKAPDSGPVARAGPADGPRESHGGRPDGCRRRRAEGRRSARLVPSLALTFTFAFPRNPGVPLPSAAAAARSDGSRAAHGCGGKPGGGAGGLVVKGLGGLGVPDHDLAGEGQRLGLGDKAGAVRLEGRVPKVGQHWVLCQGVGLHRSVFAEAPLLLEPAHRSLEPLLDRRPRQVLQHLGPFFELFDELEPQRRHLDGAPPGLVPTVEQARHGPGNVLPPAARRYRARGQPVLLRPAAPTHHGHSRAERGHGRERLLVFRSAHRGGFGRRRQHTQATQVTVVSRPVHCRVAAETHGADGGAHLEQGRGAFEGAMQAAEVEQSLSVERAVLRHHVHHGARALVAR